MYYSILGTVITMVFGTLVSWWTATEEDVCDERMLNPYFVKVLNFFRKRKEKRLTALSRAPISSIEDQFNEHTNQAFDNSVEAGNSLPKNAALELQPSETYRKIGDNL